MSNHVILFIFWPTCCPTTRCERISVWINSIGSLFVQKRNPKARTSFRVCGENSQRFHVPSCHVISSAEDSVHFFHLTTNQTKSEASNAIDLPGSRREQICATTHLSDTPTQVGLLTQFCKSEVWGCQSKSSPAIWCFSVFYFVLFCTLAIHLRPLLPSSSLHFCLKS